MAASVRHVICRTTSNLSRTRSSSSSKGFSSWGSSVCERYPRGRSSLLVFVLNLIAFYAFGAALIGILDFFYIQKIPTEANHPYVHFIKLLVHYGIVRLFYPVCGLIADVYIRRWRMMQTFAAGDWLCDHSCALCFGRAE